MKLQPHVKKKIEHCPLCKVEMIPVGKGIHPCPTCGWRKDENKEGHIDPRLAREAGMR